MGALIRLLVQSGGTLAIRMLAGFGLVLASSLFIKNLFDLGVSRFLEWFESGSLSHTFISLLAIAQVHTALAVILSAYAIVASVKASSALIKRSM